MVVKARAFSPLLSFPSLVSAGGHQMGSFAGAPAVEGEDNEEDD